MAGLIVFGAIKLVGDILESQNQARYTETMIEIERAKLAAETAARERAEEQRRVETAAREEAERQRREAEERRREEAEARREAEQRAEEERRQREALEQLMRDLGMDPSVPEISEEEIAAVRQHIGYDPDKNNIAVTGNLNAGKSSLINALRNSVFGDSDYAPTGAAETTMNRHKYLDPIHADHVWYDTPGAGTPNVTTFGYYRAQKLFAYDMVVLAHESSLTESDVRLLEVCQVLKQPAVVVRTKCDMHIQNYMGERNWTSDRARITFLRDTHEDVRKFVSQSTLAGTGLDPHFSDLIISAHNVRRLVKGEPSPVDAVQAFVDEPKFLQALGIQVPSTGN
ncbi:interferon-inducible GTPase-domain-containing protein [Triangularia verruculosa]|uniref:Interferon-inducible GTPase-domain-containing protein n=1 Tax=Triangularia verruculosa TaxID=2587418 RepID=A0AAN6XAU5_9PEZI|nr:interferon-inducible GTPase-domain-containing protein [Triangularia verruculosa]